MSATALILQMTRAHYRGDETAFAYSAAQLAKRAKPELRDQIETLVNQGKHRRSQQHPPPANGSSQRALAPLPNSGILQSIQPLSFPDLLLDDSLQANLDEIVVELEYRDHLAKRGLRARNRLLFWGPPGNGKTSAGGALANALGVPAYVVSLPDLVSCYMGSTGRNLGEMFSQIRNGMVVVFDELDAIGAKRGSTEQAAGKEQNAIVNGLLTQLDKHADGVLIGTTNRPDILDPALLRRFDEQIFFPAPSDAQKAALSGRLCEKYEIPLVDVSVCENFDRVNKEVTKEARRAIMRELLSSDSTDEEVENGKKEE